MKKYVLSILVAVFCSAVIAQTKLQINGTFFNPTKNIPAKWIMNAALKGQAKLLPQDGYNQLELKSGSNAIHLYSSFNTAATAGEKLVISVKVKGSGKAIIGIYSYSKKGRWIGKNTYHYFAVQPEWQQEKLTLNLADYKNKKLGFIRIMFGVGLNSSVIFSQLSAEKTVVSNSEPKVATLPVKLTLPKTFYGVPGITNTIYLDNIILTPKATDYRLSVEPALGKTAAGVWQMTPSSQQVGSLNLKFSLLTAPQGKVIDTKTIMLNIAPKTAGMGKHFKLLIIGDSLTAAGLYPKELVRLLHKPGNPTVKLLGSVKKGTDIAYEGYGGWTWQRYLTQYIDKPVKQLKNGSSPFVFINNAGVPKLDLDCYFKEKCQGSKPDIITIMLGINDCFGLAKSLDNPAAVDAGMDKVLANADIFINALHRAAPNALIGICLTTPPNSREKAFFANYKGNYSRWGWKQVQYHLVQRQLKHFANREQDNIYIIPTELNVDSVNGYPENNGVHPNKLGYEQIASTIYCWLKWQFYRNEKLNNNR